jgi:hypothetical protein
MVAHTLPIVKFFLLSKEVIPLYLPYTPWGRSAALSVSALPYPSGTLAEVKVDLLSEPSLA